MPAHPSADADVLVLRGLEVFEVLLQRGVVELSKKMGLDAGVELADLVDQLTFAHVGFTFKTVVNRLRAADQSARDTLDVNRSTWRANLSALDPHEKR